MQYNPKASELIGLDENQLNGKKFFNPEWEFIKVDNKPLTHENYPVNEILKTKKLIKNFIIGIKKNQNNSIQWLLINGFPVFNNLGEIDEFTLSSREILLFLV